MICGSTQSSPMVQTYLLSFTVGVLQYKCQRQWKDPTTSLLNVIRPQTSTRSGIRVHYQRPLLALWSTLNYPETWLNCKPYMHLPKLNVCLKLIWRQIMVNKNFCPPWFAFTVILEDFTNMNLTSVNRF